MSCSACDEFSDFDVCISCGEILKPIFETIQEHHKRMVKLFEKPDEENNT